MQKKAKLPEKKFARRDLLKLGGLGIAALATAKVVEKLSAAEKTAEKIIAGRRLAMVIDLRKCYGCHSCSVSCKAESNVRLGGFRSWVNYAEKGKYPDVKRFFLPRLCNHCQNSPCEKVCPTKATYKRADGVVVINKNKCIGCRYCMNSCPYGSRYFNWRKDPSSTVARTPGVADKCDFCVHRIDNGVEPACVNTCPANARTFGDLLDPHSEVSKLIAKNQVQVLLPEKGTKPQIYYIGADESVIKGSPEGGR